MRWPTINGGSAATDPRATNDVEQDVAHIRELTADDGPAVQSLLKRCADYYEELSGLPPGPAEAQSLYISLPPGKTYDDKFLFGVVRQPDDLIGVIELIRDHPEPQTWFIGVILIDPAWRRKGFGRLAVRSIENRIRRRGGTEVRAAVATHLPSALAFCTSLGYTSIGESFSEKSGEHVTRFAIVRHRLH